MLGVLNGVGPFLDVVVSGELNQFPNVVRFEVGLNANKAVPVSLMGVVVIGSKKDEEKNKSGSEAVPTVVAGSRSSLSIAQRRIRRARPRALSVVPMVASASWRSVWAAVLLVIVCTCGV